MVDEDNTRCIVGYDHVYNQVVLAYTGSSNLDNWLHNLQFMQVRYESEDCENCLVHKGFYDYWKSVGNDVMSALAQVIQDYPTCVSLCVLI